MISMIRGLTGRIGAVLAQRRNIVGINRRNVELVYPNNPREFYPLADDKLLTKEWLKSADVSVPKVLAVCDGLYGVSHMLEQIKEEPSFVVKPANGYGGFGLLIIGEVVASWPVEECRWTGDIRGPRS